jgi:hypothetical protein
LAKMVICFDAIVRGVLLHQNLTVIIVQQEPAESAMSTSNVSLTQYYSLIVSFA